VIVILFGFLNCLLYSFGAAKAALLILLLFTPLILSNALPLLIRSNTVCRIPPTQLSKGCTLGNRFQRLLLGVLLMVLRLVLVEGSIGVPGRRSQPD